jgi:hypothetical protein
MGKQVGRNGFWWGAEGEECYNERKRLQDGAAFELQEHRMSFPMVLSSPLIGYCDRACLQGFA